MDAIIFLHTGHSDYLTARGYEDYLAHVLRQARRSNPGRRIVLLGDRADAATKAQVEFRDSKAYDAGAAEFRKLYAHLSPNTLAGERFCFERWFIVRDFAQAEGIASFLCADSDVVILSDLAACKTRFGDFDLTLSEGTCAHASYWARLDVLDRFCDFVMRAYAFDDPHMTQRMMQVYRAYSAGQRLGGVSDMTLLQWFAETPGLRVVETTEQIGGRVFDNNINVVLNGRDRFRMRGGVKDIHWKDGAAYGRLEADGTLVRFDILHCSGPAKRCIIPLCQGRQPVSGLDMAQRSFYRPARDNLRRIASAAKPAAKSMLRAIGGLAGMR